MKPKPPKKKIVFIINSLGVGGAEKQLFLIINGLKHKYDFSIITLFSNNKSYTGLSSVPINHTNLKDFLLYPHNIYKIFNLYRLLKKKKPDIVHSWLYQSNFISAVLKIFFKKVRLITSKRGSNFWYKKKHFLVNKFVYKISNAILVNSISLSKEILNYNSVNNKLFIVPNGIDLNDIKFENNLVDSNHGILLKCLISNKIVIGCVGRFVQEKRYQDIIQTARILIKAYNNIHFILVGGRGKIDEFKQLVSKNNIEANITFTNEVKDVYQYMKIFDIFLLSSSSEGLPNSLMEAMAMGLPVVTTNVGGIPDLIQDGVNGFMVPPYQPKMLTTALKTLINDKRLRKQFGDNNLQKIKKYSTTKMVSRIDTVYHNVLNSI